MTITENLDRIEKLVLDRVEPAGIRGHIQAIREQLEAHEQEMQKAPDFKAQIAALEQAKANEIAKLNEEITRLKAENAQLVAENTRLNQQPLPSFSTGGRKRQFGRDQQSGV